MKAEEDHDEIEKENCSRDDSSSADRFNAAACQRSG